MEISVEDVVALTQNLPLDLSRELGATNLVLYAKQHSNVKVHLVMFVYLQIGYP